MKTKTFNDLKTQLTEDDINQIVALVGHRARFKTKKLIRNVLEYYPSSVRYAGILERLVKDGNEWEYIAGQSYPDEIRRVRELIIGK
jgi:hypothetical protein